MLEVKEISYSIGSKSVLNNVSAAFFPGTFNMILGPNGSGKSSLLKIFSGEVSQTAGAVFYEDRKLNSIAKTELAKQRAVMSQLPELSFPLLVEEVVMMGRYPHFVFNPGKKDLEICNAAMEKMDLTSLKDRNYLTLSGGEKQRVQFARVLAQIWEKPERGQRYLFLDEPLTSLDINYQQEFLKTAKTFCDDQTVLIAVIHDINLAIQYGDQLFFLKEGHLFAKGSPAEIVSTDLIQQIFSVHTIIGKNPVTEKPMVIFS